MTLADLNVRMPSYSFEPPLLQLLDRRCSVVCETRTGKCAVVSIRPLALEALGLELSDELTVTVDLEREWIVLTLATLPGVQLGFLGG